MIVLGYIIHDSIRVYHIIHDSMYVVCVFTNSGGVKGKSRIKRKTNFELSCLICYVYLRKVVCFVLFI